MEAKPYPARPKVLYIGGTGRTGSTLLTRLLGEVPGWFAAGELAFLWRHGLRDGGRCSCDAPIAECVVWSEVLRRVDEACGPVDPERMVALREKCWSVHLPIMGTRWTANKMMDRLDEFPQVVEAMYRALAAVTESQVIVDSSKEPHYSWILRERTDLDIYFVQLVRDPRAVAHSWRRRRSERGFAGDTEMDRRGPLTASTYYTVSNVAAEAIWSNGDRFRFLRYEDFVSEPAATLEALAQFVGEPLTASPLHDRSFESTPQHMAWGNPNRFGTGAIDIRGDEAWRTGSGKVRRLVAGMASAPVARRYGYPLRSTGPRTHARIERLRDTRIPRFTSEDS